MGILGDYQDVEQRKYLILLPWLIETHVLGYQIPYRYAY
jgi:hypothetical protein